MKFSLAFLILLAFDHVALSQTSIKQVKGDSTVKIKDWNQVAMMYGDNYWNDKADGIIRQIGKEEFEKVKAFSDYKKKPCQMTLFCEIKKDGAPKRMKLDSLHKKLSMLKAYKIATYPNVHKDGVVKMEVILRVPYEENKDWDGDAKWDTVYFTIDEDYVEGKRYKVM
jgi:hypothetical protein